MTQLALVIGAGYGADLTAGRTPRVQVIVDGSDSSATTVALGYASSIVGGGECCKRRHERSCRAVGLQPGLMAGSAPSAGSNLPIAHGPCHGASTRSSL